MEGRRVLVCVPHRGDAGQLAAGAKQAALQDVPLLDDALHGRWVVGAHLDLLARRQQRRLQRVLRNTATTTTQSLSN